MPVEPRGWLTGWKSIMAYLDIKDYATAQRYVRLGLPILRLPETNIPVALPAMLDKWIVRVNTLKKRKKKKKS